MQVARFSFAETGQFDRLISDYITQNDSLKSLHQGYPELSRIASYARKKHFSSAQRQALHTAFSKQYASLPTSSVSQSQIDSLLSENTFTVTTGHQLCLFTGPMYFVFKIASTIALSRQLNDQNPDMHFVPIFWMASEDHDFEEINHTWVFGNKIEWNHAAGGAVGRMDTSGMTEAFQSMKSYFQNSPSAVSFLEKIESSFGSTNLADATQYIAHILFNAYGLLVLNPDETSLKKEFAHIMWQDLTTHKAYAAVNTTNEYLQDHGYKTQVNAREINLFYLSPQSRVRIEKSSEQYFTTDHQFQWTEAELKAELEQNPERFSPNVIMRPMYQESILPNLAYIGGPGETAYWLQLMSAFESYGVSFPFVVLRDSFAFVNSRSKKTMEKLGLEIQDIFHDRETLLKKVLPLAELNHDKERDQLKVMFQALSEEAKNIDPTLEGFVQAELQRQLQGIDGVEKKMLKAIKTKEEVKIQQLDKWMDQMFPGGGLAERKENFSTLIAEFGEHVFDTILAASNPLAAEIKVLS